MKHFESLKENELMQMERHARLKTIHEYFLNSCELLNIKPKSQAGKKIAAVILCVVYDLVGIKDSAIAIAVIRHDIDEILFFEKEK